MSGRNKLETAPSPGPKPQRRGRPKKKIWEGEGDHPKDELSVHPTLEESIMPTNCSELVGTAGKGGRRRKGRVEEPGASVQNFAQQLEQAQIAIAELYQENRELQHQLVVKTERIPLRQGRAGCTIRLQRQLREAQDTIVELREAQQMAATTEHKTPPSAKDNLREDQSIGDTLLVDSHPVFLEVWLNTSLYFFFVKFCNLTVTG
jgi:hypothetical protein